MKKLNFLFKLFIFPKEFNGMADVEAERGKKFAPTLMFTESDSMRNESKSFSVDAYAKSVV